MLMARYNQLQFICMGSPKGEYYMAVDHLDPNGIAIRLLLLLLLTFIIIHSDLPVAYIIDGAFLVFVCLLL